jgi:hypothetical protein
VVLSKDTLLLPWFRGEIRPPDDWLILARRGFPEASYLERFGEICALARASVCFIGDLDPLDLTSFLALRALDQDVTRSRALRVEWCGVSDSWLRLCRRNLRKGQQSLPLLDMKPLEREHWLALTRVAPELREAVGPECAALLDDGKTFAIEGASGTAFYNDEFPNRLFDYLKRRIRRVHR